MKTMNLFNSIAAEIGITYHNSVPPSQLQKITQSNSACDLFRSIWNDEFELYESFYVLFMNRSNSVLGYRCISQGGVSGTVVDPKAVFQAALMANACSMIMAHNHPSGNIQPSEADSKLTKKLREAGSFLDIDVLDHLILTQEGYYSYADQGMI